MRNRPDADGLWPHPGLWLIDTDWSESRIENAIIQIDIRLVAPLMCRLGRHRWISTKPYWGTKWTTQCWYCRKPRATA